MKKPQLRRSRSNPFEKASFWVKTLTQVFRNDYSRGQTWATVDDVLDRCLPPQDKSLIPLIFGQLRKEGVLTIVGNYEPLAEDPEKNHYRISSSILDGKEVRVEEVWGHRHNPAKRVKVLGFSYRGRPPFHLGDFVLARDCQSGSLVDLKRDVLLTSYEKVAE